MKCLPSSKLPQAQGNVLHDWHAEILAIRAFNRFLLEECRQLALGGPSMTSPFLRRRTAEEMISPSSDRSSSGGRDCENVNNSSSSERERESETCNYWHAQPFAWREDVALHMYCSEAPCGDASMELTMAAQTDASPWEIPIPPASPVPLSSSSSPPAGPTPTLTPTLPGRAYFSLLGAVRRKPSRGDAPPTLSKSCSDKLALKQCTSLLSSTTSLLVSPAYLRALILPAAQHDEVGCRRAFSDVVGEGRMASLKTNRTWSSTTTAAAITGGYAFHPFEVRTTDLEFKFSRREVARRAAAAATTITTNTTDGTKGKTTAASNLAVAWTAAPTSSSTSSPSSTTTTTTPPIRIATRTAKALEEATLGGTLQGRRKFDARGASFASRRRLWGLAAEVARLLALGGGGASSSSTSAAVEIERALMSVGAGAGNGRMYGEVKQCRLLAPRRRIKEDVRREALRGWVRNEGDDGFSL